MTSTIGMKKTLEGSIVTEQQAQGLKAFRLSQSEQVFGRPKDNDFMGWYQRWQFEQGYFDDSGTFEDICFNNY